MMGKKEEGREIRVVKRNGIEEREQTGWKRERKEK